MDDDMCLAAQRYLDKTRGCTVMMCDPLRVYYGNEADAEMEEARAQDCHRDALDAMGIG